MWTASARALLPPGGLEPPAHLWWPVEQVHRTGECPREHDDEAQADDVEGVERIPGEEKADEEVSQQSRKDARLAHAPEHGFGEHAEQQERDRDGDDGP